MNPLSKSKSDLRRDIKLVLGEQRPFLSVEIKKNFSENLSQFLKQQRGLWAGFKPMSQEIDWQDIIPHQPQIQWAWPKVSGPDLNFYVNPSGFISGYKKILEPQDGSLISISDLSGFLVPGLAFDSSGHRLGYGAGFYDRALQGFKKLKVGLCFSIQYLKSTIPTEEHDVLMSHVITEDGIFNH